MIGLGTFGGWTALGGATILAQAAPTDLTLGTGLLTYGPLGIMVAGFMFGQIVPGPTHKRVVEENTTLRTTIDQKVWPTINDATAAQKAATAAVVESTAAVQQANATALELARLIPDDRPAPRPRRRPPP